MAENNSVKNKTNQEELEESSKNLEPDIRREIIDKDNEIIELQKKLVNVEEENQKKLVQYDNMMSQIRAIQQRTDLILRQERMHYQENSTDQYFKLLHAEYKINDLETENNNLVSQVNSLNAKLEAEVNKLKMMKQAYSGVFEAFVKNFIKLYSVLHLQTGFLESSDMDYETKIKQIFANFPELLKLIESLLNKEKDLEKHLEIALNNSNDLKISNSKLITENNNLKAKLDEMKKSEQI